MRFEQHVCTEGMHALTCTRIISFLVCVCDFQVSRGMALSGVEQAKRAFVSLLLSLARLHGLVAEICRDSSDSQLLTFYRRLSRKVHPDRGGSVADAQRLNAAKDSWDEARKAAKRPGDRGSSRLSIPNRMLIWLWRPRGGDSAFNLQRCS